MTVHFRGVPTAHLTANPTNIRDDIVLADIEALAASIRTNGILQPLIVNRTLKDELVVTDGHRRLAAARLAQVPAVPCLITDAVDDRTVLTTMLATAMHKELTPIEQARAFAQLRTQGMFVADIARATGYTQARIKARLLLLDIPKEAQDMVENGEVTLGQATSLAKQVRAKGNGTTAAAVTKGRWFTRTHRLARHVQLACDHTDIRQPIGGSGCGQCWEAAIRADAIGSLGDPPPAFDEAAVIRALSGERMNLTRADRLEATTRLHAQGHSDSVIADRLHVSDRQVIRDRQTLDLPTTYPHTPARKTA